MASRRPEIALIAALTEEDRVIGLDNDLPWHIPEDLEHFKRTTSGHPLLAGRKTFEAILNQFGGPLPDRRHVVLTRSASFPDHPDIETVGSIPAAMNLLADEELVYVGGGQTVYEQFLPAADRLVLTLIESSYEGDTYFPKFEHLIGWAFERTALDQREGFRFVTYRRRPPARDTDA